MKTKLNADGASWNSALRTLATLLTLLTFFILHSSFFIVQAADPVIHSLLPINRPIPVLWTITESNFQAIATGGIGGGTNGAVFTNWTQLTNVINGLGGVIETNGANFVFKFSLSGTQAIENIAARVSSVVSSNGYYILRTNGIGYDLTVSNSLTLVRGAVTAPWIDWTNPPPFPDPPPGMACTNTAGPYYPCAPCGTNWYTNVCGFWLYYDDNGTNWTLPATNVGWFNVAGAGTTNANGDYFPYTNAWNDYWYATNGYVVRWLGSSCGGSGCTNPIDHCDFCQDAILNYSNYCSYEVTAPGGGAADRYVVAHCYSSNAAFSVQMANDQYAGTRNNTNDLYSGLAPSPILTYFIAGGHYFNPAFLASPPTTNGAPSIAAPPGCPPYLTFTRSGVTKYLKNATVMLETLDQIPDTPPFDNGNGLILDANGNAYLVIGQITVKTMLWTGPDWLDYPPASGCGTP